jgi:hypothetical protein
MTTATTDFRTEANYVDVRGNHNTSLFAPNFYSPNVWLTNDRLEVTYSLEYGFLVRVIASITRTPDGYTLVGAHRTVSGDVTAETTLDVVRAATTREALLDYAGRVDALTREAIIPQIVSAQ